MVEEQVDPRPPDTTKFADPHRYATYLTHRSPAFKTHSSLRAAKGAIAGKASGIAGRGGRQVGCHAYVYEFNFETGVWDQIAHIFKGANLDTHPWYSVSQGTSKAVIGPSQAAVDAALRSILRNSIGEA